MLSYINVIVFQICEWYPVTLNSWKGLIFYISYNNQHPMIKSSKNLLYMFLYYHVLCFIYLMRIIFITHWILPVIISICLYFNHFLLLYLVLKHGRLQLLRLNKILHKAMFRSRHKHSLDRHTPVQFNPLWNDSRVLWTVGNHPICQPRQNRQPLKKWI